MAGICLLQQRSDFLVAKNVRRIARDLWQSSFGQHIRWDAKSDHIQRQLAQYTRPVVQGRQCLIGSLLDPGMGQRLSDEGIIAAIGQTELIEAVEGSCTADVFIAQRAFLTNHAFDAGLEWTLIGEFIHEANPLQDSVHIHVAG